MRTRVTILADRVAEREDGPILETHATPHLGLGEEASRINHMTHFINEQDPSLVSASSNELFNAAQLLLAEKRTALSILRTGVAIFVIPLSVLSLLIATAKTYRQEDIFHLLIPVLIICASLILLSVTLIGRALLHLHRYDKILTELKRAHPVLSGWMD